MGEGSVRRSGGEIPRIPETYRGPYSAAPGLQTLEGNRAVHLGQTGPAVGTIQELLNRCGADVAVDNDYGPYTAQAVQNFQLAHDLEPDGKCGRDTIAALRASAAEVAREAGTSLPPSRLPTDGRANPGMELPAAGPTYERSTIVPTGVVLFPTERDASGHWKPRSSALRAEATLDHESEHVDDHDHEDHEPTDVPTGHTSRPPRTPRETGTRETTPRETGTRETTPRETGTRETTPRETGTRETTPRETRTRETTPTSPTSRTPRDRSPRTSGDGTEARTTPRPAPTDSGTPPTAPTDTAPVAPTDATTRSRDASGWEVDANGTAWPPPLAELPRGGRTGRGGRAGPRGPVSELAPRVPRIIAGEAMPTPARDIRTQADAEAELTRLGVQFQRTTGSDTLGIAYPVRVQSPLMGVELIPASNYHMTMDVRMAVALAHYCMWARSRGVVGIRHMGGHVLSRTSDPNILKTDDHGRGLAFDIGTLYVEGQTPPVGRLVPGSNPPRYEIVVNDHWRTARSSADIRGGDTAVRQTAEEYAAMTPEERFLRESWGFWEQEGTYTVCPCNNPGHHNHLHVGVGSTAEQRRLSMRAFGQHLAQNPELRSNGVVPGYEDRQVVRGA